MPSVAFPAPKVRALVKDELREAFDRVAARGAMRLPMAISAEARAMAVAQPSAPLEVPKTAAAVSSAPAPTVPKTATTVTTSAPKPPATIARRAVSLGSTEDAMRTSHYQMGQVGPISLSPTVRRTLAVRQVAQPKQTTAAPVSYVGGYPTIQQKEEPDYTTWIMVGVAGLLVVGGVVYAKKKRLI